MKNYKSLAVILTILAAVIDLVLIILSRICFKCGHSYVILKIKDIFTLFTVFSGILLYIAGGIFIIATVYIMVIAILLLADAFK